jgi:hypothetical protein
MSEHERSGDAVAVFALIAESTRSPRLFDITLSVHGTVITGTITSRAEFYRGLAADARGGSGDPTALETFANIFAREAGIELDIDWEDPATPRVPIPP